MNKNMCQDFFNVPNNVASGNISDLYRVLQKLTKMIKHEIVKMMIKKRRRRKGKKKKSGLG